MVKADLDQLIKELEETKLSKSGDNWSLLFYLQRKLQARLYGEETLTNLSPQERARFVRDHCCFLITEIGELLNAMPYFKPWKKYTDPNNEEEAKKLHVELLMEFVDMLHFFLNIAIYLGLDPEEIIKGYLVKNKENHRRQDRGY